jgi:hypothetical protein
MHPHVTMKCTQRTVLATVDLALPTRHGQVHKNPERMKEWSSFVLLAGDATIRWTVQAVYVGLGLRLGKDIAVARTSR